MPKPTLPDPTRILGALEEHIISLLDDPPLSESMLESIAVLCDRYVTISLALVPPPSSVESA